MMGILRQLMLLSITFFCTVAYRLLSRVRRLSTFLRPWRWQTSELEKQLQEASSYDEWKKIATRLDQVEGLDAWKLDPFSPLYDAASITMRLHQLREARINGDLEQAMLLLRENLVRNVAGIGHPDLYTRCHFGTKRLVEAYVEEVCSLVRSIACSPDVDPGSVEQFLADSRQAYGRSALLLSGYASLGMYHWGVLRCLFKQRLLPYVICGNAIGALLTAMLGVHTDDELEHFFDKSDAINFEAFNSLVRGSGRRKVKRFLKHGVLMDVQKLEDFCRTNIGDITFKEAYNRTGRIINITLTHTTHQGCPSLLNHLTTPNLLLWSAACASCVQPGLYAPVPLLGKDMEGNIVTLYDTELFTQWSSSSTVHHPELPMERMSQLFNVNHFIVSQVSPHVIPFLHPHKSTSRFNLFHKAGMFLFSEVAHTVRQLARAGYWTKSLEWLRMEILQTYEGDITIVPPISVTSIMKILENPTQQSLDWYSLRGERGTYRYVYMIKYRCMIERALQDATSAIRKMRKQAEAGGSITPCAEVSTSSQEDAMSEGSRTPTFSPREMRSGRPTTAEHIPERHRSPPPRSRTPRHIIKHVDQAQAAYEHRQQAQAVEGREVSPTRSLASSSSGESTPTGLGELHGRPRSGSHPADLQLASSLSSSLTEQDVDNAWYFEPHVSHATTMLSRDEQRMLSDLGIAKTSHHSPPHGPPPLLRKSAGEIKSPSDSDSSLSDSVFSTAAQSMPASPNRRPPVHATTKQQQLRPRQWAAQTAPYRPHSAAAVTDGHHERLASVHSSTDLSSSASSLMSEGSLSSQASNDVQAAGDDWAAADDHKMETRSPRDVLKKLHRQSVPGLHVVLDHREPDGPTSA